MKKKLLVLFVFVLALILATLSAVQAAGPWSDNFDSYPTGTNLHGVGGWKGWDNNPAFTAFTTDVQALSAPNSVDIVANADLVHEYTNNTGTWAYRAWMYIPGNMVGNTYFIMLNQYVDGGLKNWSVQVQFQSATGNVVDDVSGLTTPYVADAWAEICVEIDLDADTQTFYYNGASLYSGVWNGYASGPGSGADAIGAVDLYANAASSVYYDDMSLIDGTCAPGPTPTPTAEPPTETPTATAEPPTETPTATAEPPTATSTPGATDVELSGFSGDSNVNVLPYVIGGVLAVVGLGWYVSRRRTT